MQIISRGQGRSAVAAAAYRAGQCLRERESGRDIDFSRRRGVVHAEIMVPEGAAPWLSDREQLWNGIQHLERRRDAQLAREINMALPCELSDSERLKLVSDFVRTEFVSRGMVADVAIHRPVPEKGEDPRNHHAHILLSLRQANADGFRPVKTREWNSTDLLKHWRSAWAICQNRVLRQVAGARQVDHRSLEIQRAEAARRGDRVAAVLLERTPERHMGPASLHSPVEASRSRVTDNVRSLRSTSRAMAYRATRYQLRAARARRLFHRRQKAWFMLMRKPRPRVDQNYRRLRLLALLIRQLEALVAGLTQGREVRLRRGKLLLARMGLERRRLRASSRRRAAYGVLVQRPLFSG